LWYRRDAAALLLFLWTGGIFFFATMLNWTINGRILLPAAPALGILIGRRIGQKSETRNRRSEAQSPKPTALFVGTIMLGGIMSLALAKADYNVANAERAAANELWEAYHPAARTVWFEGHWGFQYYMEQLGAKPLDLLHPAIAPPDFLVIPNSSPNISRPDPK